MSAFSGAESVEALTKGAKFEAKEYLPTRSVAFDEVKSSEGRTRRLFEQSGLYYLS